MKLLTFTMALLGLASMSYSQDDTGASDRGAAKVKIMPFGASIVGAPAPQNYGCWRAILWKKLQSQGITDTDFVGSNTAPDCGFPYDGDNEGHSGFLATNVVRDNQLPGWLSAQKPDVIIMHLGTNDVINHKSSEEILDAYDTLVDQMRQSKGGMKIIISTLLPLSVSKFGQGASQAIVDLNGAIKDWAPGKSTDNSPITIVDNFSGFNVTTDTVDGEHPNDKGNQKFADKTFDPLVSAIKSVSDE